MSTIYSHWSPYIWVNRCWYQQQHQCILVHTSSLQFGRHQKELSMGLILNNREKAFFNHQLWEFVAFVSFSIVAIYIRVHVVLVILVLFLSSGISGYMHWSSINVDERAKESLLSQSHQKLWSKDFEKVTELPTIIWKQNRGSSVTEYDESTNNSRMTAKWESWLDVLHVPRARHLLWSNSIVYHLYGDKTGKNNKNSYLFVEATRAV